MDDNYKNLHVDGIGSGEIAAVCGLVKWKTPFELWAEKIGVYKNEDVENRNMQRGITMQPLIIKWAEQDLQTKISPSKTYRKGIDTWISYLRNAEPVIIGTPDGEVKDENAIIECKDVLHPTGWRKPSKTMKGIPEYVRCQVTWQMAASDVRSAFVAAHVCGNMWYYKEEFDQEYFDEIYNMACIFWEHVKTKMPLAVTTMRDLEIVRKNFDKIDVDKNDFEQLNKMVDEYFVSCRKEKQSKDETTLYKLRLLSLLNDNVSLSTDKYEISKRGKTSIRIKEK